MGDWSAGMSEGGRGAILTCGEFTNFCCIGVRCFVGVVGYGHWVGRIMSITRNDLQQKYALRGSTIAIEFGTVGPGPLNGY